MIYFFIEHHKKCASPGSLERSLNYLSLFLWEYLFRIIIDRISRYDSDPFQYPFHEIYDFLRDCDWSQNISGESSMEEWNGSGQHLSTLRIGRIPVLSSPRSQRGPAEEYPWRGRSGRRRVKEERLGSHGAATAVSQRDDSRWFTAY